MGKSANTLCYNGRYFVQYGLNSRYKRPSPRLDILDARLQEVRLHFWTPNLIKKFFQWRFHHVLTFVSLIHQQERRNSLSPFAQAARTALKLTLEIWIDLLCMGHDCATQNSFSDRTEVNVTFYQGHKYLSDTRSCTITWLTLQRDPWVLVQSYLCQGWLQKASSMAGYPAGSPYDEALSATLKLGWWGDDVGGKPTKEELCKDN